MDSLLKRYSILVADDDKEDRFLIKKAMEAGGLTANLYFMEDGQKLLDNLHDHLDAGNGTKYPGTPCLILMDLNMPRVDGREALRMIKNDPRLKHIPVIILTNSKSPEDVEGSYQDGANSFFTKPIDYQGLVSLAGLLKTYWLQAVTLPSDKN
jgi:CheY-like chemotaxis protein